MKRFSRTILVFVLLTAVTFGAFGGGGQEEAGGKRFSGQKITVIYMSATYADAARDLAPEFEAETGAKVEVVDFPYVSLHEKELLDLSSGAGTFDVISIACQWDGEYEPFVEDLEPYIKKDNYDTSDILEKVWLQSGKWAGKIMGIPHSNTPYLIAYRTDLVPKFPATWDEFFDIAEKLHDPANGFYATSVPGVKEQFNGMWMIANWSLGGAWADENWNVTVDSPESRKALEVAKGLIDYSDPAAPAWGLPESSAAFLAGKSAFDFAWPTFITANDGDNPEKSKIVGKWALAPFPYAKTGITMLSSWDLAINKASKYKDASWEWIKWYTSKENQMRWFKNYKILSPRVSFWEEDIVKNSKLYPHKKASEQGALIWWRIPAGTIAETFARDAVSNYVTGQWDMDRAIKYMEDGFKKTLKDNPPAPGIKNTGR